MPELRYSRGPHLALRPETIFEARPRMARRLPAHEALVVRHQNARLTYRELKERVEETARGPRPRVRRAHRGMAQQLRRVCSFFFHDTATTEIYTLSLHDALPIRAALIAVSPSPRRTSWWPCPRAPPADRKSTRLNSSHPSISYAVFCLKKKK